RQLLSELYGQWVYHTIRAELKRARQLAVEMRDWSEIGGDIGARLVSRHACSYTSLHLGELKLALEDLEQGLALFDPADRRFYAEVLAYDPLVALLTQSAFCLCCLGRLDQAASRQDAALAEARRLSHPFSLAQALVFGWIEGWLVGSEPGSLLPCADELLTLTTEHGLGTYRAFGQRHRGWCLAALGQADEGITLLGSGLRGLHDSGFRDSTPLSLNLLAEACRTAGQLQTALEHIAEAQRVAEETNERLIQAETSRIR